MKLKALFLSLICAVAVSVFSSCNSDSDDNTQMYANIVTLAATNEQGTIFTFREDGDKPLITLTSTVKISTEMFKVGSRVLLHYYSNVPAGQSGAIQVIGLSNILGGGAKAVEATAAETQDWSSENISMQFLYRSGEYIDLAFVTNAGGNVSDSMKFYVDKNTLNSDYPEFYIVMKRSGVSAGNNALYYASYSIGNVWNLPNVHGVKIHMPDSNQANRIVTIEKSNAIKPVEPAE